MSTYDCMTLPMSSVAVEMAYDETEIFKFARLIPINSEAITCFTETFVHLVSRDDHYHLQFCVANMDKARRISEARSNMIAGTPPGGVPTPDPAAFQMLDGFYQFSLENEKLPPLSRGWRVGRGTFKVPNKGVEMMMLKSDDADAVSIFHCKFSLHPQTGVLVIKNMTRDPDRTVSYQYRGETRPLDFGQERPLCQRENRVSIGSMQFILEYTVPAEEADQGDFVAILRDALIADQQTKQDAPMPVHFLPGALSSSLQRDYLLSTHTRGFGAFGWICAAIDTRTGDASAIKALEIRRSAQHIEAVRESHMWRMVTDIPGVLPLQAEWCEHGKPVEQCDKIFEKVYFASPLGRFDFLHKGWRTIPWRDQLTMLRQTLEGLDGMHQRGIMHRDVSCKNMLVMSLKPPTAVITDLGKAVQAPFAKEKGLGPLPYVAPEVDGNSYSNMIDAWSWAYSVIVAYGFSRTATERVTLHRIANLQVALDRLRESNPLLKRLCKLLRGMIAWLPSERTSISAALEDSCWQDCSDRQLVLDADEGRLYKIQRTDTDSSTSSGRLIAVATLTDPSSDGAANETIPTQPIPTTDNDS